MNNELYHYGIKRKSGRYPYGSGERPYQHELNRPSKDIDISRRKYKRILEKVEKSIDEETVSKYRALMDYNWELSEKISKMHNPPKDLLGKRNFSTKLMDAVPAKHIDNAIVGLNGKDTYYVKGSNTRANAYHVTADAFNRAAEKLSGEASKKYAKEIRDFIDKNHDAKLMEYFYLGTSADLSDTPFGKKPKHEGGSHTSRKSTNNRDTVYGSDSKKIINRDAIIRSAKAVSDAYDQFKKNKRINKAVKGKLKAKTIRQLSDDELDEAIARLSRENEYLRLAGKKTPEQIRKDKNEIAKDLRQAAWKDFALPAIKGYVAYKYQHKLGEKMDDVDIAKKIGNMDAYNALRAALGSKITPDKASKVKEVLGKKSSIMDSIKRSRIANDLNTPDGRARFEDDLKIFVKDDGLRADIMNTLRSDKGYIVGKPSNATWTRITELVGGSSKEFEEILGLWANPKVNRFNKSDIDWLTMYLKRK